MHAEITGCLKSHDVILQGHILGTPVTTEIVYLFLSISLSLTLTPAHTPLKPLRLQRFLGYLKLASTPCCKWSPKNSVLVCIPEKRIVYLGSDSLVTSYNVDTDTEESSCVDCVIKSPGTQLWQIVYSIIKLACNSGIVQF
jgi:hypothetical protein